MRTHACLWVEVMEDRGGGEGEKSSRCSQIREFCFDWSPGCTFQLDVRGGSRVGSKSGERTVSRFCLDERKFFAQGNNPPWGVPSSVGDWELRRAQPSSSNPICIRNQCGFLFFSPLLLEALRCPDPGASNNDAFQTRTSNCLAVISLLLNTGKLG